MAGFFFKVGKFEEFWKLERKKSQNSALCLSHWPPNNWPGALDHLAIGLVGYE